MELIEGFLKVLMSDWISGVSKKYRGAVEGLEEYSSLRMSYNFFNKVRE